MPGPPSPFYGDDYVVINSGATFAIGADPVLAAGGYTTYIQYYKLGYGPTGAFTSVTPSSPFPVTVATGLTAIVSGFSGPIQIIGVAGGQAVTVAGTVNVQGLSAAPVYVQTSPNCYVEVTGGRYLNRLNDSVSVFGPNGSTWTYSSLVSPTGTALGFSGDAINVNVIGAAINATVGATLAVQGVSNGYPININDTNILSGMTAIYGQVVGLRTDLSVLGVGRPTTFKTGRLTVASVSASRMDSAGYTTTSSITVKALSTNTDFVYVGNTSGLIGSSFGHALDPGESIDINVINTNTIYAISNTGTQVITYLAS
jgi:hypothetical protein